MKKIVFAMAALLSTSAAFVSCTDTEVFDEGAAEQAKVAQVENKYKEAFVEHFGEVAPNQSWDFSMNNVPEVQQSQVETAETRATLFGPSYEQLPAPTFKKEAIGNRILETLHQTLTGNKRYPFADEDFPIVQKILNNKDSIPVQEWPYQYAQINLHPFFSHGSALLNFYFLGVEYTQKDDKFNWGTLSYNIYEYQDFHAFCFKSMGNKWSSIVSRSDLKTNWGMNNYVMVNTTNMNGQNGFKWFVASRETDYFDHSTNAETMNKCKIFNVNNRTYVAFDCDGDGRYWDLVCWLEDLSPAKRYMVEDLGSIGDFDFNDIVFDVVCKNGTGEGTNKPAQYECLVRAMGGTIDFTIKVGQSTWTKSTSQSTYAVTDMVNTKEGDYDTSKILASFPVNGWIPAKNDVTVTVVGKDGIFVLPFPKDGEIPYIVCTSVGKDWSKERINVETLGWFGSVENDGKIEVKNAE